MPNLKTMERSSPKKVLIVDDSSVMRQLIQKILERDPQFTVVGTASNGLEALDRVSELLPDLITMDVEMPVMDGISALQQIMTHYPVPVLMLSSHTNEGSAFAIESLAFGAADFFHKDNLFQRPPNPLVEEEFLLRCKAALRAKTSWHNLERWDGIERTLKTMIEFMAHCLNVQQDITPILDMTIRKLNGIQFSYRKIEDKFIHMKCSGDLLVRFGITDIDVIGQDLLTFLPREVTDMLKDPYHRAWDGEDSVSFHIDWKNIIVQGVLQPVRQNGIVVDVIGVAVDLTDQKRLKDQMNFLTNYDTLTGLPNRRHMLKLMEKLTADNKPFTVQFVNLDHFKLANDTLGYQVGDRLLQMMSRRLKKFTNDWTTAFRLANDEFVLVAENITESAAAQLSDQLLLTIRQALQIDGHEIQMSASIGISRFPMDEHIPENLILYSKIAMNHAKHHGGNRHQSYDPSFYAKIQRRMTIEQNLRKAIERQEFVLHYQPQVDVTEGKVIGLECLIRWESPEFGRVSPTEFIPVAEETGLIYAIGEWALWEACRQNYQWQQEGLFHLPIAVNLSSLQFYDQKLKERLETILTKTGLHPSFLELEITESMTMHVQGTLTALRNLKSLGATIAIDDFGTGYSSLSYLKEFPIDKLKIDQSFIKGITANSVNASIVRTITEMAKHLNMKVIAEGVEEVEQLAILNEIGCYTIQGYLFSKPLESDQVPEFIANFKNRTD